MIVFPVLPGGADPSPEEAESSESSQYPFLTRETVTGVSIATDGITIFIGGFPKAGTEKWGSGRISCILAVCGNNVRLTKEENPGAISKKMPRIRSAAPNWFF